jgi:hypothetical protein
MADVEVKPRWDGNDYYDFSVPETASKEVPEDPDDFLHDLTTLFAE